MIVLAVVTAVIAVIIVTILVSLKFSFTYWSKRNVFTLPPVLPFGNGKDRFLGKTGIIQEMAKYYQVLRSKRLRYGGYHMFLQNLFVPADLDLIRNIMVSDFHHFTDRVIFVDEKVDPLSAHLFALKGSKWRALRTKLTPLFTSGKLKLMFQAMVGCTENIPIVLDEFVSNGESIEIKEIFARYTTDIIASVGFGIESNCLKNPNSEFRKYGKRIFEIDMPARIRLLGRITFPKLIKWLKIPFAKPDVQKFFIGLVKETIEFRDRTHTERNDFMQLLMKLRNEQLKVESSVNGSNSGSNNIAFYQNGLSVEDIAAQAFVFFIAGFETSSTTLNFFMYELAINPEIQDKLRNEIKQVLAKHNGQITYEAVQEMTYLDQCVYETLRKYPPVAVLTRECTKTYKVPDSDLTIEKGTRVMISPFGIQHDPEIYPDPEKFDPNRFSDENKRKRHPMSFLSFGEGPRICIGLRMGLLQTKVGLIAMLKDYKFTLDPKTRTPLEYEIYLSILSPKGGIWLNASRI
ncbi:probable cytochrome P450 6a13 isoform X2 [Agrilus planipennis]|uniref:Probable cytochrome P450 6a13 isoform X1 n=1 Tax=Agrilus planipennis TaxID=224129 RepID=A0A7F5R8U4_AGRPL|nr:probable cytochrome P450 6a13 isoform X1 [Agrilus planipennis]XP_025832387.1 probable cytochrome P450 6a13 isoform X2 [Agrilus planipennis]